MVDNYQASIIVMEGKLCNQFVSTLIDPNSNYSYVGLELMDKYNLA